MLGDQHELREVPEEASTVLSGSQELETEGGTMGSHVSLPGCFLEIVVLSFPGSDKSVGYACVGWGRFQLFPVRMDSLMRGKWN